MRRRSDCLIGKVAFMHWMGIVLAACCLSGCGTSAGGNGLANRQALEVWKHHEAVVERALNGYQKDDEFIDACLFFKQVTGISIHVNMGTLGFLPEPGADKDLDLIRAWYKENSSRLYWDEASKAVKVRELG